MMAAK
jgi:hypothetical protein